MGACVFVLAVNLQDKDRVGVLSEVVNPLLELCKTIGSLTSPETPMSRQQKLRFEREVVAPLEAAKTHLTSSTVI